MTTEGTIAFEVEQVLEEHSWRLAGVAPDRPGWAGAVEPGLWVTSLPHNAGPGQEVAVAVLPLETMGSWESVLATVRTQLAAAVPGLDWKLYPATVETAEVPLPVVLGTVLPHPPAWAQAGIAAATAQYWRQVIVGRQRYDETLATIVKQVADYLRSRGMAVEGQPDGGITFTEVIDSDHSGPRALRFTLEGHRYLARMTHYGNYIDRLYLTQLCAGCREEYLVSEDLYGKEQAEVGRIVLTWLVGDQRCQECREKEQQIRADNATGADGHNDAERINEKLGRAVLDWLPETAYDLVLGYHTHRALLNYNIEGEQDVEDVLRGIGANMAQWLRNCALTVALKPGQ